MHREIWAITMVRDEQDIIEHTLLHMIEEGVDGIVVANNLSVDSTPDILEKVRRLASIPVLIVEDKDPGYRQAEKMTRLADLAGAHGADYIIPFDADEYWTCSGSVRLADAIRLLDLLVIRVPYFDHWCTSLDPEHENPFVRMSWRSLDFSSYNGQRNRRIAFAYQPGCTIAQGNHYIYRNGQEVHGDESYLYVHHFPYRSVEQFITKVRNGIDAYDAAPEIPAFMGHLWREHGAILRKEGEDGIRDLFYSRWFVEDPVAKGLIQSHLLETQSFPAHFSV